MIQFINLYLIPALAIGSIYALGASGISALFGILRFAHFAHGDLMTVGAYGTMAAVLAFGMPPLLGLPAGIALAIVVALAADRFLYKPLRALPTIYTVIASFGAALIFRSVLQIVFGAQNRVYVEGVQKPLILFDAIRLSAIHATAIAGAALIALGLHVMLTRTRTGRAMRAVADEPDLALASGLDPERVIRVTWIMGAALAAVAGTLAGMDTDVHPNLGWNLLLAMFAAAILGGIGKPLGAMAGGFIIGLAEELSAYPWLGDGPLISPGYKSAVAFFIMVMLLLFRPRGLFKGRLL